MACRIVSLQNEKECRSLNEWLSQRHDPGDKVEQSVHEILKSVRERGDQALVQYTRDFDCSTFAPPLRVSAQEIERAAASVSLEHREVMISAAENIRNFHKNQLEKSWFVTRPDGSILGQQVVPVDAAGLYIPGGQGGSTPLVSSLLMNAIPAQVAGVARLAVCTPPCRDGSVNPSILAAAHLLDIEEVYRVGGPWSVAALAYGTQSIPAVDVIAGPGNIFVTMAKKLLQGTVGIDMLAGPSEILVVADSSANPFWIAADMLSQAEHDPLASALCVTNDPRLADSVRKALESQCADLPRSATALRSLEDWGAIIVTPDLGMALAVANSIAPEHLEICTRDPWAILPHIRHAGAIFLGHYSPEAAGDYFAGPNHVLPTMGAARFSSALSVQTFCKKSSVLSMSAAFLRDNLASIAALARMEGLEAHARSVEIRKTNVTKG
jgi:histidinol dehydrogenase